MRIMIFPGSMRAAGLAVDIFGGDRVEAGDFTTPVYVNDVEMEEIGVAKELLGEHKLSVTEMNG